MSKRRSRVLVLSAAALVGGLALTGCSGATTTGSASGSSTESAPAPSGTPSASSSATGGSAGGATPTGGPADGSTTAGTPSGAPAPGASASGGSASGEDGAGQPCRTAGLGFEIAPGSGAQAVGEAGGVVVRLTNKGSAPCTLKGYPGVDLVGATTWSLPRQTSQKPRLVTLKPGSGTTFTVTYQSYGGDGVELTPRKMVVTPPGETHPKTLTWDFSSVLLQDGATHPGSYVGPVGGN